MPQVAGKFNFASPRAHVWHEFIGGGGRKFFAAAARPGPIFFKTKLAKPALGR
jgi:hypothetical protein